MQGASMPGRLGSPQELSPTTPPTTKREDPVADSAAARRGGGGASEAAAMTADPAEVGGGDGRTVLGRLGLTLSSHNEVFPSRVMLSPGTDSDPGSSPSPEVLVRRSSRPFGGGDAGQESFAPPPQEEGAAAQKEEEAGIGEGAQSAVTHEPTPSPDDVHGVTISPPSASDSSLGSNLWCSGPFARSTFGKSMGGQGADEARDGLLATRSGKMRALGTLDLMQVVGTFSDSESPSDDIDIEETSPRARAAAASNSPRPKSPRPKSPRPKSPRPSVLPALGSGATRPSSPITTQQPQQAQQQQQQQEQQPAPSPLPPIQAGLEGIMAGVHFPGEALSRSGYSPGMESSREYSESDDEDTPGGGMLKGEGLV
ncbi:unnamed protein product [Ectocarpus sp. 12 AP-2014]